MAYQKNVLQAIHDVYYSIHLFKISIVTLLSAKKVSNSLEILEKFHRQMPKNKNERGPPYFDPPLP